MQDSSRRKLSLSRRDFLKRAPVAIASGFVLGILAGKPLLSRLSRRQEPEFPKDSIFKPAVNRRKKL